MIASSPDLLPELCITDPLRERPQGIVKVGREATVAYIGRRLQVEESHLGQRQADKISPLNSGGSNTQATGTSSTPGGLFGNANSTAQSKPAGSLFGGLGGNTQQTQSTGSSMFSGLSGQQQGGTTGGGLFGSSTTGTSQPQTSSLFGGATGTGAGAGTNTNQGGTTGGSLFGGGLGANSTAQPQQKSAFGGLGSSTATGGLLWVLQDPINLQAESN